MSKQQSYILLKTVSWVITHGRRSKPAPGKTCAMIVSSISMYSVVLDIISYPEARYRKGFTRGVWIGAIVATLVTSGFFLLLLHAILNGHRGFF